MDMYIMLIFIILFCITLFWVEPKQNCEDTKSSVNREGNEGADLENFINSLQNDYELIMFPLYIYRKYHKRRDVILSVL